MGLLLMLQSQIAWHDVWSADEIKRVVDEQVQCVATVDLYNRSIVYASNLVTQNTRTGKAYDVLNRVQHAMPVHVPNIISIWIIKNEINHGIMKTRHAPVEEVSYCFISNNFENEYKKFVSLHSHHSGK